MAIFGSQYLTIKQSPPPVTIWYSGHGVVPIRQVIYHHVCAVKGIRHETGGKIQYKNRVIYVIRRALPDGSYTRWEALQNVNLIALS